MGNNKAIKTLYLKIELGKDQKFLTYTEKNSRDTLLWYSSFSTNIELDLVSDELETLKEHNLVVTLYEKRKGNSAEEIYL